MEQNEHLELGKINRLKIDRFTSPGAYCVAKDDQDVLLPNQYLLENMKEGDLVDVFLYTDSQDRLVATTQKPLAMLDEMAFFEVVDITPFGAFVDWGLPKDLLVPKKLQKTPFVLGEKRFLKVIYDEKTHRLVATEKLGDFLKKRVKGLKPYQEVDIVIFAKTPLGFKTIINDTYEGLLYHNEIFEEIKVGDSKKAYIKQIRADGKIDLTLKKAGQNSANKVLEILQKNNGMMPYNYKSDAKLIRDTFGLSKKDFKRSLTTLLEKGKIEVKDTGIYLVS
ncbi:hypothetical protein MNB_SM-3-507 [hydrothermal vent metagenome]|uniref:S1 RNA binding domain n=1 Tax=hydrothermal vent metagenome TaxID=652676 RepID=A0A1W1D2I4_9ZZZZ